MQRTPKSSMLIPSLRKILLAAVASHSLIGCKSEKTDSQTGNWKAKKEAVGAPGTDAREHATTFNSILGNKDLSKVDWDKIGALAKDNLPEFEKLLDYGNSTLQDTPETRDEFFRRCIWFARERETKEVINVIEQHGKGQGKKMAYGSLIGIYAEDPDRLKDFIEQMPYGEPRSKGFQRYYIITTKSVEDFESGIRTLAETGSPEDRMGIRLGLKQSGESLLSNGQATADHLNSLVEKILGEQKVQYGDFKF